MKAINIIKSLRNLQVSIKYENDNLKLLGNTKALTSEQLDEIKENKNLLIQFLKESQSSQVNESIVRVTEKEYYPTSNGQKRLWLLSQFEGGNKAYNITAELYLKGNVINENLEKAFQFSIDKHESLRTVFILVNDEPVQQILPKIDFKIDCNDISSINNKKQFLKEEVENAKNLIFDLKNGPLITAKLYKISEEENGLIFSMHHIISDGWSIGVLVQEIMANYKKLCIGQPIDISSDILQYKDYVEWLANKHTDDDKSSSQEYWSQQKLGTVEPLNLPTDYKRPDINLFEGAIQKFYFEDSFFRSIENLARKNQVTLFNVYRACLTIMLYKISGHNQLILGTPVSGRTHPQLNDQIGLYVNTLPLFSSIDGSSHFKDYLKETSLNSLQSFEYQDYPLDLIIENSDVQRDTSRNPLFDIMLVLQNTSIGDGSIDFVNQYGFKLYGLDKYLYDYDVIERTDVPAKFDLTFNFAYDLEKGSFLEIEYRTKIFKKSTIQQFYKTFSYIIEQVICNEQLSIDEIQLVDEKEKNKILTQFNKPIEGIREEHIFDLFTDSFERNANKIALVHEDTSYTYKELLQKVMSYVKVINDLTNGETGLKIGMLLDRSENILISVLAILASNNTYVPVDITYPDERIDFIISDSEVSLLLIDNKGKEKLPASYNGECIDVTKITDGFVNLNLDRNRNETVYLIYTSGSTGKPKGVEITHENVIAFLKWAVLEFKDTPYQIMYAATSYCFDLSVFEMFLPIIQGKTVRLLKSAIEIPEYIHNDEKVFVNTVPSVVRTLLDQQMSWDNVIALNMAGEPVPVIFKDLLDYKKIEVRNLYGPSEDTTYSTMYRFQDGIEEFIPIGTAVGYTQLYILDSKLNIQPVGVEGEICLSGLSVAKGYLKRPDLTAEKFIDNPFVIGQKLYKTGDTGKWLPDGKVAYVGRMDDQVKVRGYRIELGEIQYRIEQMEEIDQAVVLVKTILGESVLVAYYTCSKEIDENEIVHHIKENLPHYMLPSYYVLLDKIPLNSNGKVDKKRLPPPDISSNSNKVNPKTELQQQLLEIWKEVLNRSDFGITDNFFELGGHSLKATKLKGFVSREIEKEISINEIFQNPTIEEQSKIIELKGKIEKQIIEKQHEKEFYPLSFSQERLWVLTKFDEASKAYHMPVAFKVKGNLDLAFLKQALNMVVQKHESLRTVFKELQGKPVQRIIPKDKFLLEVTVKELDLPDAEIVNKVKCDWLEPFDLENGPLLRCCVYKIRERYILSFNMHHIISDGWSIGILFNDVVKAYQLLSGKERSSLLPLEIQYKDFALWQRKYLTEEILKQQLGYWKDEVFENDIPVLELPTDFHRPDVKTYNGDTYLYTFSKDLSQRFFDFNIKNGVSSFINLMTSVSVLMKKLTNQSDIVIGTPVAGRDSFQLQNQIGFYVNTLPLRTKVGGTDTYRELLSNSRENILKSFDYQHFPFEVLVEELQPKRDMSRSPLFDVMVVYQNIDLLDTEKAKLTENLILEKLEYSTGVTKYDITLSFSEFNGKLHLELEYNTDLFKNETIQLFVQYLSRIIDTILENDLVLIKDISLVSFQEETNLLMWSDNTDVAYETEETIVSRFSRAVELYPDHIALQVNGKQLTYRELDEKSGQLARMLNENYNVVQDDLIVLHTGRSEWMLITILGVLKSGAAYVPIDPEYPESRIEYILNDSKTRLILCDDNIPENIQNLSKSDILFLNVSELNYNGNTYCADVRPDQLAYVIYTSGTTGNPKGVLIEHRNVNRLLFNENDLFDFNSSDRWTLFHSYCFDFSVWEMYGAILKGGTLVMVPKDIAQDSFAFYDFLVKEKITVLNQTPTAFRSLSLINSQRFNSSDLEVRYVIFGGEALMPEILEPWSRAFQSCKLINMYGITETTVHVTYKEITPNEIESNKSLIGQPIPTLSCYVLDQDLKPVIKGVVGELCIGGAGVARGYHNRPELTVEKFITSPFNSNERLYRSGDFARILDNGEIEYIGRKDEQVKIRGHRIEVGEIETTLVKIKAVKDAVVLAVKNTQNEYELVAYIIPNHLEEDTQKKIRDVLKDKLPSYMVPSYFIELSDFPLTSNGKLDKNALPNPITSVANKVEYVPPRNSIDQTIIIIWEEILEQSPIGIKDNFFDLGGHSLKATRVLSKIQEIFGVKVDLKNLFIDPTVEHLSNFIETIQWMEKEEVSDLGQDEMIL